MKRYQLILICCLLLPGLSGCWDHSEPERMVYIHGLGVDFKEGKFEVYAQIIDFTKIAKTEQPQNEANQSEVGHASGNTVDEAIFNLYHSVDQRVYWGHFTYLILSEELLKRGKLDTVIDSFIRSRETRYQIWVYATSEPIEELLLVTPVNNKAISLSKLADPRNSYKQESYIKPINVRQLIIGLNEPGHEMVIPYVTISEHWADVEGQRTSENLAGVAVVSLEEMKGTIEGEKAYGLQWMSNASKRGEITFRTEGEEGYFNVTVDSIKVKVKPVVTSNEVRFDIDINLNAIVGVVQGGLTTAQVKKEVEQEIKKEIKTTYNDALSKGIDIYRFSEQLYREDVNTWKKLERDGRIELTEDSIGSIKVNVYVKAGRKAFQSTVE